MNTIVLIHSNLSPLSPVLRIFFELVHYEQKKSPPKFNIDPCKKWLGFPIVISLKHLRVPWAWWGAGSISPDPMALDIMAYRWGNMGGFWQIDVQHEGIDWYIWDW